MQTLKVIQRMSVREFKQLMNAEQLVVIKSPKSGKLFVDCGSGQYAAVSSKYDANKPCSFVEIQGTSSKFWLLCNQGTANVVQTL
jgi:hypothetical protein